MLTIKAVGPWTKRLRELIMPACGSGTSGRSTSCLISKRTAPPSWQPRASGTQAEQNDAAVQRRPRLDQAASEQAEAAKEAVTMGSPDGMRRRLTPGAGRHSNEAGGTGLLLTDSDRASGRAGVSFALASPPLSPVYSGASEGSGDEAAEGASADSGSTRTRTRSGSTSTYSSDSKDDSHSDSPRSKDESDSSSVPSRAASSSGSSERAAQDVNLEQLQPFKLPVLVLEGPHGAPSQAWDRYRCAVLVAGGIGVTPIVSVLSDILYRIRAMRAGFHTELNTTSLEFIWVARTLAEASWLKDLVREIEHADDGLHMCRISLYVTQQASWKSFVTHVAGAPPVAGAELASTRSASNAAQPTFAARPEAQPPSGDASLRVVRSSAPASGGNMYPSRGESPHARQTAGAGADAPPGTSASTLRRPLPISAPAPAGGGQSRSVTTAPAKPATAWSGRLLGFEKTTVHMGRPPFEALLAQVMQVHGGEASIGVFACGPHALTRELARAVRVTNARKLGPPLHAYEEFF